MPPMQSSILIGQSREVARVTIGIVDTFVPSPAETDQSLTEAAMTISSDDAETSRPSSQMVDRPVPAPITGPAIPQLLSGGAAITASLYPNLVIPREKRTPSVQA